MSAAASGPVPGSAHQVLHCASLLHTQNEAAVMVWTSGCPIRHKHQDFTFTVTGMSAGLPHIGTIGCFADHRRLQALVCLFAGVDLVTSMYCVSVVHAVCRIFRESSM